MGRLFSSLLCLGSLACGPLPADNSVIEIEGTWATPWGDEVITAVQWQTATIITFDNDTNTAITQMPADDEFNPNA